MNSNVWSEDVILQLDIVFRSGTWKKLIERKERREEAERCIGRKNRDLKGQKASEVELGLREEGNNVGNWMKGRIKKKDERKRKEDAK